MSSGKPRETVSEKTVAVWVREWPTSVVSYPATARAQSWIGENFDPDTAQDEHGGWCVDAEHASPIIAAMRVAGLEVLQRREAGYPRATERG